MARGVFTANSTLTATSLNDCFDPPRCRVRNSANIAVANTTNTIITFDTEEFDVGGMHSTTTNTGRITIPTGGDGTYLVGCHASWAANATGARSIYIRLNGSTLLVPDTKPASSATVVERMGCSTIAKLVAGDYVEVIAYQESGGSLNITTEYQNPGFYAIWLAI